MFCSNNDDVWKISVFKIETKCKLTKPNIGRNILWKVYSQILLIITFDDMNELIYKFYKFEKLAYIKKPTSNLLSNFPILVRRRI